MAEPRSTLERSYRRLLLAYPRFYRRLRGAEMLTTMLDAAKPGQNRPAWRDALHLVLAGLRMRLVPPGWAGPVVSAVATLWLALVLGGAGAYVVWADRITFPHDARLGGLVDTLGGGEPIRSDARGGGDQLEIAHTYRNWIQFLDPEVEGWRGADPAPFSVTHDYAVAGPILAQAHGRLQADGWDTGQISAAQCSGCRVFWAARGDAMLRVHSDDQRRMTIGVHGAEPKGLLTGAVIGFGVGLVLAWPVMTWLIHRFARAGLGSRLLMLAFGLPALAACVINTVDNIGSMLPDPDGAPALGASLLYPLANQYAFPVVPALVMVALVASLGTLMRSAAYRTGPMITAAQAGNAH